MHPHYCHPRESGDLSFDHRLFVRGEVPAFTGMTTGEVRVMRKVLIATTMVLSALPGFAQERPTAPQADLSKAVRDAKMVEPFKVFDNLYYVGMDWVSAWLIPT